MDGRDLQVIWMLESQAPYTSEDNGAWEAVAPCSSPEIAMSLIQREHPSNKHEWARRKNLSWVEDHPEHYFICIGEVFGSHTLFRGYRIVPMALDGLYLAYRKQDVARG